MFQLWNRLWPKRPLRCPQAAARLRFKPSLEALEDRLALSAAQPAVLAALPPEVNGVAAVATAFAGETFTGVLVSGISLNAANVPAGTAFFATADVGGNISISFPGFGGFVMRPAAQPIPLPQPPVVTGPVPVADSDPMPWAGTRDQGLYRPLETPQAPLLVTTLDVSAANALSSQAARIVLSGWVNPAAVPVAIAFVSSAPPLETGSSGHGPPTLITTATPPGVEAAPDLAEQPQETGQDVYHVPLYRVAERGEFGGLGDSPSYWLPSAALPAAGAHAAAVTSRSGISRPGRAGAEENPPAARLSGSVTIVSLLEVATAWVAFQVLQSTVLDRSFVPQPGLFARAKSTSVPSSI